VLEALGGYVLARAYVRNYAQFTFVVRTYFILVLVVGAFAIFETFFGIKFIHALASMVLENPQVLKGEPGRLGLDRAMSTFDHPIHYGAFCATSLGLVLYTYYGYHRQRIMAAAIVFAAFCAVSTAPLLACALAVAFMFCERWSRPISNRVAILISLAAIGYATLSVLSNRSVVEVLISLVALDQWTAYYRLLIWQFALGNIANNPLFGIGIDTWTRPDWMPVSVDSFWLVIAMAGGLPTTIFLGLALLLLLRRVHTHRPLAETQERWQARLGWTVAVLALVFQAFTVHYWGSMNSFFFFVLGLGAWMTDSMAGLKAVERSVVSPGRPRMLERRSVLNASAHRRPVPSTLSNRA
jgi:O-antigen ligase